MKNRESREARSQQFKSSVLDIFLLAMLKLPSSCLGCKSGPRKKGGLLLLISGIIREHMTLEEEEGR